MEKRRLDMTSKTTRRVRAVRNGVLGLLLPWLVLAWVSCGGGSTPAPAVSVAISPVTASVQTGLTQLFTATVSNTSNTAVTWQVGGTTGGNSTVGTISTGGLYTAPAAVPSPAAVTVTVISQADNTKSASATVTVTAPPVSVSISPTTASVATGANQQFTATVTGTANTAVTWQVNGTTGGDTTHGTISASGLYTAPAAVPSPATVTVAAVSQADATKSASATVTVTGVSVSISPTSASVAAGGNQQFTATVTGTSNTAVTWQVGGTTGGNSTVGTISASGLFTAPAAVPSPATVTVTCVSQADVTKSAAATVTITAAAVVAVSISPTTASVAVGGNQQFTATVTGTSNTAVTWQVNGTTGGDSTNGTISASGLYTAPAAVPSPATVTVACISQADPTKSDSATVTITPTSNNALLSGPYAFQFIGYDSGGLVVAGGTFNADGSGTITTGNEDINRSSGVNTSVDLTGTYTVGADKRGVLTLTSGTLGSATYRFALKTSGDGYLIEFDDATGAGTRGSGVFRKQDATAFNLAQFSGSFAFGFQGELNGSRAGAVGRLTSSTTGVLSGGVMDVSVPDTSFGNLTTTGNLFAIDTNGRGTATLNVAGLTIPGTFDFTFYVVSATEAFFVQVDVRSATAPVLIGTLLAQAGGPFSAASWNTPSVLAITGSDSSSVAAVGLITPDGAGNATGLVDVNDSGTIATNSAFTATYTIAANGRGEFDFVTNPLGAKPEMFYMVSPNKAFLLEGTVATPGSEVTAGTFEGQSGGPFSDSSLSGAFAGGTFAPGAIAVTDETGEFTADGAGNLAGTADQSSASGLLPDNAVTGTYSVAGNGRTTVTVTSTGGGTAVLYFLSPTKVVGISESPGALPSLPGPNPVLFVFEN